METLAAESGLFKLISSFLSPDEVIALAQTNKIMCKALRNAPLRLEHSSKNLDEALLRKIAECSVSCWEVTGVTLNDKAACDLATSTGLIERVEGLSLLAKVGKPIKMLVSPNITTLKLYQLSGEEDLSPLQNLKYLQYLTMVYDRSQDIVLPDLGTSNLISCELQGRGGTLLKRLDRIVYNQRKLQTLVLKKLRFGRQDLLELAYVQPQLRHFDTDIDSPLLSITVNYMSKVVALKAPIKNILGVDFGIMKSLVWLDISGCSFKEWHNSSLRDCPSLKVLIMNHCLCDHPEVHVHLVASSSVVSLEISYTYIKSVICRGGHLEKLNLKSSWSLEHISCKSDHLEELNLSGCDRLEDLELNTINLKKLNINKCKKLRTLQSLKRCKNLEHLQMAETMINLSGLSSLKELKDIELDNGLILDHQRLLNARGT